MDKHRIQELAGMLVENTEEQKIDAAEEAMMKELHPLKAQLDAIMRKYPHASYDDVLNWLKQ